MRTLVLIVLLLAAWPAYADCTPANDLVGPHTRTSWVQGGLVYDLSDDTLKTCDGTNWNAVGIGTANDPRIGTLTTDKWCAADGSGIIQCTQDARDSGGIPALTKSQRDAISSPPEGMLIYQNENKRLEWYDGTDWVTFAGVSIMIVPHSTLDGTTMSRAALSCKTILNGGYSTGNGAYWLDPDGESGNAAFQGYCDMTTDGGGWTIFGAWTGATGEQNFVSNTEVAGNPLAFAHYNINRAKKMALSANSGELLLLRNNGIWLKANAAPFDANLNTTDQHTHVNVTLTANNGATASGVMGYSNYWMAGGGDFGITTTVGFDHHHSAFYHLRSSCTNMYLYSYGGSTEAGYDVNTALGSWTITNGCHGAAGGTMTFYAAMR